MRARSASGAISPIPRTPEAATSRPVVVAVRCGTAHPMAYLKKDAPADVVETLRQARSTGRRVLARSADPEHATRHAGADEDRPPGVVQEERLPLCRKRSGLFVLHVRVEDAFAHGVLRRRVDDRPQEREAPALAAHRVLARRERDVPAVAAATLPDAEADQLQARER